MLSSRTFYCPVPLAAVEPPAKTGIPHKDYRERLPGSQVGFDMVAIPDGIFERGSPVDEKGRAADEGPQHPVQIRPFWMGKTEVTWDEYNLFRKGGPAGENDNEACARHKC